MSKLLTAKDILFLALSGIGDLFQEMKDPAGILSSGYKQMYGFVPGRFVRRNFYQATWRAIKTGDMEKVVKNNKPYLILTSRGKERIRREFPLIRFSRQWNQKWVMLIFDIQEKSRKVRNRLRNKLKNIGFGMLQESAWITPLPIMNDLKEFIESNGLEDFVFVLEVGGVLLGKPKELANRVWNLEEIEEKRIELEQEKIEAESSLKMIDDRHNNRDNSSKEEKEKVQGIYDKQKKIRKKEMELILSLPFLYKELLPDRLKDLF